MAKGKKHGFSFISFQLCRSRKLSSSAKTPVPVTHKFSPINSKSFDISYPNLPGPPPSTPVHPLKKRGVSSEIVPERNAESVACYGIKKKATLNLEKNKKEDKNGKRARKSSVCSSICSVDCEAETESLLQSSQSFDSSYDFGFSFKTIYKETLNSKEDDKKKNLKLGRMKSSASDSEGTKFQTAPEKSFAEKRSVFGRRFRTYVMDGKVRDSFAVMKKSSDPYEDFKMSMLEMILEKEMFEAEDLEQLLLCLLSLNLPHHHAVIVEAFTDVWKEIFWGNL